MRSHHLRQAALLALGSASIGIGFGVRSAHATELTTSNIPFEWSAPEGCPGRAEVLKGLGELLDADATSWDRFENVRGHITRREAAFELQLEFILGRRVERRTFTTRDCADLSHAAAVALALVLDPAWDWTPEAASAAEAPQSSVSIGEADRGAPEVGSAPRAAPKVELLLGAEGVIDTATLGPSALGVGLSGRALMSLGGTRFGAELFGTWLPAQSIDVRPTESVQLGLMTAGMRACNWPSLALGLCAEMELGRLSASGVGDSSEREAFDTWIAPGASVVLESHVFDTLLLDSRVSLLAPLARPQYFINQIEGVHEVPGVTVRVALGVALPVR